MSEIVPFDEAVPGMSSYIYDVSDEGWDYSWITDTEWLEDPDEPLDVKRQLWMLVSEDEVRFHPSTELCPVCKGDGRLGPATNSPPSLYGMACRLCKGDGGHPLAGTMEVLS